MNDFEKLLQIDPAYEFGLGYLLHMQMHCCHWGDYADLARKIDEGLLQDQKITEPFCYLPIAKSPALSRRCAEISLTKPAYSPPPKRPVAGRRHKICLGYIAGEFREHATSYLLADLLEQHDTSRFELIAFDNGWDDGSPMRRRLHGAFKQIVDVSSLSDQAAATLVRDSGVDILVDLNGHVGLRRTGILSQRPAPVQVNWLGFPGTIGAEFIDYIIADEHTIPPDHEAYYTESIVRLPDSYQVNDAKRVLANRTLTRTQAGLPDHGFVFCCFNNNYKIIPEVFDVWMKLLVRVDRSVLWLLEGNSAASCNLRSEAAARGIAPERLIFAPRMDLPDHLARHGLADLFLDTLPCNAHTTASDALWAGLPLLTCEGTTFPGRVGSSLLHAIGLPELVTRSLSEYESLALQLALTPRLLYEYRTRLACNRGTHPLFDTARFRHHIESAYVTMHERCLRGLAATSFSVAPLCVLDPVKQC